MKLLMILSMAFTLLIATGAEACTDHAQATCTSADGGAAQCQTETAATVSGATEELQSPFGCRARFGHETHDAFCRGIYNQAACNTHGSLCEWR